MLSMWRWGLRHMMKPSSAHDEAQRGICLEADSWNGLPTNAERIRRWKRRHMLSLHMISISLRHPSLKVFKGHLSLKTPGGAYRNS